VIPGKIVRFLEQYANVGFAGTRDRHLVPHGHRVSGWRVADDQRVMTMLVADGPQATLVESLQDNGELAVTIEEFPSHETYQFKGRYLSHRPVTEEEIEIVDRTRKRFVKSIRPIFPDAAEDMLSAVVSPPSLAVDFEVLEIYLQTPGPGAGSRLIPPVER